MCSYQVSSGWMREEEHVGGVGDEELMGYLNGERAWA